MALNSFRKTLLILIVCCFTACHSTINTKTSALQQNFSYHAAYDDSTLSRNVLPVMMPYNRIIDPAGKVVTYGDPDRENHSLDLKHIPGTNLLAVEDRYGIAIMDFQKHKIVTRWTYTDEYSGFMSTYSGIQVIKNGEEEAHVFWSAANGRTHQSLVFQAQWNGKSIDIVNTFDFKPEGESPLALPNELAISTENGQKYLYVVLNGNNKMVKIDVATQKTAWIVDTGVAPYGITIAGNRAFVTNWGSDIPTENAEKETAGVPYGSVYTDPQTGATLSGSVSVFDLNTGDIIKNIEVGLHPNDIISSHDSRFVYVANSNSDNVSVISTQTLAVVKTISVRIIDGMHGFIGDSPNALAISRDDSYLYVANGMDNAVAVVKLEPSEDENFNSQILGFIPTEAYPGGLAVEGKRLFVANLEGEGARVNSREMKDIDEYLKDTKNGAYNSHHQKATLSVIDLPDKAQLDQYTSKVKSLMLSFRTELARLAPREGEPARPMPERIGEPSVFKHVIYIIKENRTYDQVLGDMAEGNGRKDLCIFGDSITPNQHQLARSFVLLDNYYASGKCSAEGHQWTDAAMVTDYVEKNVRAWFRSYPHVQNDALVYGQKGFIWNNAADHGKKVRIYGEACEPNINPELTWTQIYEDYKAGKPLDFHNTTTISRVEPMLSQHYPGSDQLKITDQLRATAFIEELKEYEKMPGDQFPELSVMALSVDHTAGTRPGMPTPKAMVADNDLALGRIIEAVSKSRFWKNTVIFVTEDDSQAGWDHVSAYRTTGFVVSPYSRLQTTVSTNYNQTCVVRSIEQILGIPPMNLMDATALPMFDCFENNSSDYRYDVVENKIPLNEMNPGLSMLNGKALFYAKQSMRPEYDHIDSGKDDVLNRILWFSCKGKAPYPAHFAGKADDDDDDDD